MSIYQAQQGTAKIAADLTSMSVMNSTSKYVKEGPVPVGSYDHPRTLQPNQRYGANRRLQRKPQDANSVKPQERTEPKELTNSKITLVVEEANKIISKKNQIISTQRQQEASQTTQITTPRAQKADSFTYQKVEKVNQTPRNALVTSQVKSALQEVFDKTPPQTNRYGPNRRIPQQKTQQNMQKTDPQPQPTVESQQPQTKKSTPIQTKQTLQPPRTSFQSVKPVNPVGETPPPGKEIIVSVQQPAMNPTGRYGANRRLQPQKVEQVVESKPTAIQDNVKEATPIVTKQVKTFARNYPQATTPSSKVDNSQTPVPRKQTHEKDQIITVEPEKTEPKVLTRSNVRPQLKSKTQTPAVKKEKENQNQTAKQVQLAKATKQSKILLVILINIYRSRILQPLALLQERASLKKKKVELAKILVGKLQTTAKLITNELCKSAFNRMIKMRSISAVSKPISGVVESMKKKSQSLLILLLNQLYIKQCSHASKKIYNFKCKGSNPNPLLNCASKICIKTKESGFHKLKIYQSKHLNLKRLIQNVNFTFIQYRSKICELVFRRLLVLKKQMNKSKVNMPNQKGSPIHDFDQDLSSQQSPLPSPQKSDKDQKLIEQLELAFRQNTIKLQSFQKQFDSQKVEAAKKLESMRAYWEQLSQQNEQKKKISEQLKEKALSIQFREEDYIQTPDSILDTKFPLLYDAFIKIEKSSTEEIKINSLVNMFPGCAEEAARDKQVREWEEVERNLKLRKEVSRYEGQSESVKKASRVAGEESELLSQLSRGYIKERYSWEWVKSALTNVPHS